MLRGAGQGHTVRGTVTNLYSSKEAKSYQRYYCVGAPKRMNFNGGNFVQQIQIQKAEKARTIEQLKALEEKASEQYQSMYSAVLGINAEIANKFFKELSYDISFSSRVSSAVNLMVKLSRV